MCGRFSISKEEEQLEERFKSKWYTLSLQKRYNIAPTDSSPVLACDQTDRLTLMKWGILPQWSGSKSQVMINARSESLLEKAIFRKPALQNHALVLSDGYFEWKVEGKKRTPFFIHFEDKRCFYMAAIFQEIKDTLGNAQRSFSILTRPASGELAALHDRMPVILEAQEEEAWFSEKYMNDKISQMVMDIPVPRLTFYSVSEKVNNARYDGMDVLKPYQAPPALTLFD